MFRRRHKLPMKDRVLTWLWPQAGVKRAWRYLMFRLARMPGSSYSIAAGFACGAAASFTPFVGLHFVIAAIVAWIMRANVIAAAIGTAIGNPWTFPFIWVWLYESGNWFLSKTPGDNGDAPNFYATFSSLMETVIRMDMDGFMASAGPVFWPMFLSGIPSSVIVWLVFFFPLRNLVRRYQRRRRRKLTESANRWRRNAASQEESV